MCKNVHQSTVAGRYETNEARRGAIRSARNPRVLFRQICLWIPSPTELQDGYRSPSPPPPHHHLQFSPLTVAAELCVLTRISASEWDGVTRFKCERIDHTYWHLPVKYWSQLKTFLGLCCLENAFWNYIGWRTVDMRTNHVFCAFGIYVVFQIFGRFFFTVNRPWKIQEILKCSISVNWRDILIHVRDPPKKCTNEKYAYHRLFITNVFRFAAATIIRVIYKKNIKNSNKMLKYISEQLDATKKVSDYLYTIECQFIYY
jgi:hypothetical protein